MTPEDYDMIFSLVSFPGEQNTGSREVVLNHFGTDDGQRLGVKLLREAIDLKDADDLEAALVVCSTFGVGDEHVGALSMLLYEPWHRQHENVVSLLDRISSPKAVEALCHAATWVPEYLDFDESRALAVKAIWALGDIPGTDARNALSRLCLSGDEIVRMAAEDQMRRQ